MKLSKSTIALVLCVLAAITSCAFSADEKRGPTITNKVYFDVTIDGQEAGTL
jgi:uncharacterized membrane protein YvbJ